MSAVEARTARRRRGATLIRMDARDDQRFVIHNVPWDAYVALRDALDEQRAVRMTYLDGTLELMRPGSAHEIATKVLSRLLEAWAVERDIDLRGAGSTTFRRKAKRRGIEPDECYTLGPMPDPERPHLALEVVTSNPLVDKLAVYAGLEVREVWVWSADAITVHALVGDTYVERDRSALLPDLHLALLASFVKPGENQTALTKAYLAALRA